MSLHHETPEVELGAFLLLMQRTMSCACYAGPRLIYYADTQRSEFIDIVQRTARTKPIYWFSVNKPKIEFSHMFNYFTYVAPNCVRSVRTVLSQLPHDFVTALFYACFIDYPCMFYLYKMNCIGVLHNLVWSNTEYTDPFFKVAPPSICGHDMSRLALYTIYYSAIMYDIDNYLAKVGSQDTYLFDPCKPNKEHKRLYLRHGNLIAVISDNPNTALLTTFVDKYSNALLGVDRVQDPYAIPNESFGAIITELINTAQVGNMLHY